jgi:hypothetical protein
MGAKVWFYHPIHGGHMFEIDSPPDPALGWFDHRSFDGMEIDPAWQVPLELALEPMDKTPKQIAAEEARSAEPELADPTTFTDVDAYMAEFVARLDTSLEPADRDAQHKRALTHFANVSYALGLDKRKSVEKLAIEVRDHAKLKAGK